MAVFSVLNGTGLNGNGIQFGTIMQIVSASGPESAQFQPTSATILYFDHGATSLVGSFASLPNTVTELSYSDPATATVFSVTGMNMPFDDIFTWVSGTGDELAVLASVFSGNDTIGGSTQADRLMGFTGDDTITGGGGDDRLDGGAGADRLDGGADIDTAVYDQSSAGVTVDLSTGTGSGGDAQGDTLTGIEDLVGSFFNDVLRGDSGNNVLAGGHGWDVLDGGAGIDTADYSQSPDYVVVDLQFGFGLGVGDSRGDTLTSIENVIGSDFDDDLVGSDFDNVLSGEAGNDLLVGGYAVSGRADRLDGGSGDDELQPHGAGSTLIGGDGIDTVRFTGGGVTVDLAAGTAFHSGSPVADTLTGIENVIGSGANDRLFGDGGANALSGDDGDDVLRGRAGGDVLDGGSGSDFANYQGSAAAVTIDLLNHTASGGDAQGDTLTAIENLYGSSHDDHLSGDDGRNVIGGELGNDVLAGNGGDDSLSGEGGDDSLDGGAGNDRLVGGDGVDTIHGGIGNDSIDAGTGDDQVFGEAGDDAIYGGTGNDRIDGSDGNDTIEGDGGADTLIGGAGIDTVSYASSAAGVTVSLAAAAASGGDAQGDTLSGFENVFGSALSDVLTGDAGSNTLWGGAGTDLLTGGVGADLLKGGAGNDRFVYASVADSTVAAAGKDLIADFQTGDKIDLSAIDADGNGANGNNPFTFGTGGFTGRAGEVRVVDFGDGRQGVYLDTNGDRTPDSIISAISDHPLSAADFVL